MSLYLRAWLMTGWVIFVFISSPRWFAAFNEYFGNVGQFAAVAFWLGHGVAMAYLFKCPVCGQSIYVSTAGRWTNRRLWPYKVCSKCGRDHTI